MFGLIKLTLSLFTILTRRRAYLSLSVIVLLDSNLMIADEPLYTRNLSTIAGLVGFPTQRDAAIVSQSHITLGLHSAIANNYISENNDTEALLLDGEFQQVTLEVRYGFAEKWDLQLEIPWVRQSGGRFDGVIDDFHKVLGLAGRGRNDVDSDILKYRYVGPKMGFDFENESSGIGDISLSLSRQLHRNTHSSSSITLGYKFPSGDEESFLGSGESDAFIKVNYSDNVTVLNIPFKLHGQLGYIRVGNADIFGSAGNSSLWFAGATIGWLYSESFSLLAQFDAQSSPVNSGLSPIGDEAYFVTFGARWKLENSWSTDLSIVENVQGQTAPDVIFQFSVRKLISN